MVSAPGSTDHYETLGLDVTATPTDVHRALDALAEEARASVASDPERSHQIWAQIRQIREDLLGERSRREAYDLVVLAAADGVDPLASLSAPASQPFVPPPRPRLVVANEAPAARPIDFAWAAAIAAVLALLLIAGVVLGRQVSGGHHTAASHKPSKPVVPTVGGTVASVGSFTPGQRVVFHWAPLRAATSYRVQVATGNGKQVLSKPLTKASFGFTVAGNTTYAWRVQALVHGHWTPFGRASRFSVPRQTLGRPVPLLPANAALSGSHVQLCWGPVAGANAYVLSISGLPGKRERNACASVTLRAGKYIWSVRAVSTGKEKIAGPRSTRATFTVRSHEGAALVAAVTRVHARTHSRAHSRTGTRSHTARRTASTMVRRTVHRHHTARKSVTSAGGVSTASRTRHVSAHSTARRHPASATHAKPRHRHHAPSTTTVTAPPPPPPPPAPGVASTAPAVPTPHTSVASAPISSGSNISGTYYSQSPVAGKTATPSGGVVYTPPSTPTNVVPVVVGNPTSTPSGSIDGNGKQHPAHPDHPDHPAHPVHPVHPTHP